MKSILILAKNIVFRRYDLLVFLPIIYIIFVTSLTGNYELNSFGVLYKNLLPPYIIYFFLRVTLTTLPGIYGFLKVIIYSGIITSFYVLLEVIQTIMRFWSSIIIAKYNYIDIHHPYYLQIHKRILAYYQNEIDLSSGGFVFRPAGIFFDIHGQGFILLTALVVIIFTGEILRLKEKVIKPIAALISLSILATTSGTYIVLTLMVLSYIFVRKKYLARITSFIKNRLFYVIMSLILSVVIIFIAFFDYFSIFGRILGFTIEGLSGKASHQIITTSFILFLFQTLPNYFTTETFSILFGFGYKGIPALGGEAHFLGEHITYIGIIGFLCYWIPILRSLFICRRCIRIPSQYRNLFMIGFLLSSCLIVTLIHYSPMNICTVFIIGFLLYIGFLGDRLLKVRLFTINTS